VSGQDFNQGELYWSESCQRFEEIKLMPCPFALRALAKLERTEGFDILTTPLAQALKARAESGIDAEVTEVATIDGGARMLRDRRSGKFRGAYASSRPKGVR